MASTPAGLPALLPRTPASNVLRLGLRRDHPWLTLAGPFLNRIQLIDKFIGTLNCLGNTPYGSVPSNFDGGER